MARLFDKLDKLSDHDLNAVQVLAMRTLDSLNQPLATGETFETFFRRTKTFMAAHELRLTAAIVRRLHAIESPLPLDSPEWPKFRKNIVKALKEFEHQRSTAQPWYRRFAL
jgi:hypothetical protein